MMVEAGAKQVSERQVVEALEAAHTALKQIVGMPDYARYLEHANLEHPNCPLLSEREFYDQYLAQRYGGGATRCC